MRAPGFDDVIEFDCLGFERSYKEIQGDDKLIGLSSRAASRIAVGNTSLVDWAMSTWSFG